MSELRDLYQEVILDHNKRPRNFRVLTPADHQVDGHNPLCGDRLTVYLRLEGRRIADVSFVGTGCAISKASASMMTDSVKGLTIDEVETLFNEFHAMVTSGDPTAAAPASIGKLAVFAGVAEYPTRVKCATLAWHTLQAALHMPSGTVTTDSGD